ncbi:MAG: outer membrane beta-barrel protein [Prevotellaceae bacterium]|jgi:hypothetical protein|nr:outer membrane beta-barrel protein [Prevotellaceae bacterium]
MKIMKTVSFLFLFLFVLTTAQAQFFVEIDTKGGMGNIGSSDLFAGKLSAKFSFGIGITGGYVINRHFPVSIGLHYSHLKFTYDITVSSELDELINIKSTLNWKTMQIPLTIGYCHDFDRIKLFTDIGVFGDYFLSNNNDFRGHLSYKFNIGGLIKAGEGVNSPKILCSRYRQHLRKYLPKV